MAASDATGSRGGGVGLAAAHATSRRWGTPSCADDQFRCSQLHPALRQPHAGLAAGPLRPHALLQQAPQDRAVLQAGGPAKKAQGGIWVVQVAQRCGDRDRHASALVQLPACALCCRFYWTACDVMPTPGPHAHASWLVLVPTLQGKRADGTSSRRPQHYVGLNMSSVFCLATSTRNLLLNEGKCYSCHSFSPGHIPVPEEGCCSMVRTSSTRSTSCGPVLVQVCRNRLP